MTPDPARRLAVLREVAAAADDRRWAVSVCRSCGAAIVWVVNEATGKAMPLDAEPVDGGNVVLGGDTCVVLPVGQCLLLDDGEQRYVSHFATCPDASSWRSKRSAGR